MKRASSIVLRRVVWNVAFLACVIGLNIGTPVYGSDDDLFGGGGDDLFGADAPAPGPGGNNDIDALFGTFSAEPEPEPDAPQRVLPPFTGNYKILVARPVYAVYEAERNTQWISAIGELFTHYKVASFPRTQVFTQEQVSGVLPNFRDYGRRFSRQHYIDAARKLGATHLLYSEYQPQKGGRTTQYSMDLFWIAEGASVTRPTGIINHNDFEGGMNAAMARIAEAMDPGARSTAAFNASFLGSDSKVLEELGGVLVSEGNFTRTNSATAYAAMAANRTIQRNGQVSVVQYASALLAGRAEEYQKAVTHMEQVVRVSGDYPALQLYFAEYLRGAGRHSEAMRAAETAARMPALRVPASIEMAAIHQAQGNLDRARSEYETMVASGDADGRALFRLALLSIKMGRLTESEDFMRRAEQGGFALDEDEYFQIGQAYAAVSGQEGRAIEFLRRSMGVRQNSEHGWEAIAEVHKRTGSNQQEAEAYVNMFMINQAHSQRLKTAGQIYERIGMTDKAKDAYALFMDRRFHDVDVAMSLARIYFNEKECKRLPDVLKGLDTIQEAAQMLQDCGFRVRRVDASQTMRTQKLSPLMLTLRITGGVLFAGGLGGGLYVDKVLISDLEKKYSDFGSMDGPKGTPAESYEEVQKMRKDIESNQSLRNILYIVSGVGLAGFAVTFFF